ncbi:MAG: PEP-CTERM sorting domain-containing protein [Verrucomicrobiota bacterium]
MKKTFHLLLVPILSLLLAAPGFASIVIDFETTDGGFTASAGPNFDAPPGTPVTAAWLYNPGAGWETTEADDNQVILQSPVFIATAENPVLTFQHAYGFAFPDDFVNGGIPELSINSGAFSLITPDGGFPTSGSSGTGGDFIEALDGSRGFSGGFGDSVTDTATLSSLQPGDLFSVRFRAAWDPSDLFFVDPSWGISSFEVTNAMVPEPASGALLLGALGLLGWRRRRASV